MADIFEKPKKKVESETSEKEQKALLVQKSVPLLLMQEVPFSFGELKILDTYISLINSHDENTKKVTISLSEYCDILGLKQVRSEQIKRFASDLLSKTVRIPAQYGPIIGEPKAVDGFCMFNMFSACSCYKEKDGKWYISMECTNQAKKLFFNIESIGYIKYALSNIIKFSSKNSYMLYLYLLKEEYRKTWIIGIEELKEKWLKFDENEYYEDFRRFNEKVLEKATAEINEKTDLKVSYKVIMEWKTATDIEFTAERIGYSSMSVTDGRETPQVRTTPREGTKPEERSPLTANEQGGQANASVEGANPFDDDPKGFAEFWEEYPRKYQRPQVVTLYRQLLAEGETPERLRLAAHRYAKTCEKDKIPYRYLMSPVSFLGEDKRYKDFLTTQSATAQMSKEDHDKAVSWFQNQNNGSQNNGEVNPPVSK